MPGTIHRIVSPAQAAGADSFQVEIILNMGNIHIFQVDKLHQAIFLIISN